MTVREDEPEEHPATARSARSDKRRASRSNVIRVPLIPHGLHDLCYRDAALLLFIAPPHVDGPRLRRLLPRSDPDGDPEEVGVGELHAGRLLAVVPEDLDARGAKRGVDLRAG